MVNVLVTGATGTTGVKMVEDLIKSGHHVRAGVRDVNKAQKLKDLGAELVTIDFGNSETIKAAAHGVERVVLLVPWIENFDIPAKQAVEALKAAGVKFVLKFSAAGADAKQDHFLLSKQHGISDDYVRQSGLDYTVIQPNFFMDNWIVYGADNIKKQGASYGAAADGKVAYIATEDISAVAAAIISNPEKHKGKSYYLSGPEALTENEVVKIIGDVIGKEVKYYSSSLEDYAKTLKSYGVPEWTVNGLVGLENVKRNGWGGNVAPTVKEITGKEPLTFKQFAQLHASAWK